MRLRICALLVAAVSAMPFAAAAAVQSIPRAAIASRAADGRIVDVHGGDLRIGADETSIRRFVADHARELLPEGTSADDLRLASARQSLTGTHFGFRQYVDGIEVVGGDLELSVGDDGVLRELHSHLATRPARSVAAVSIAPTDLRSKIDARFPELAPGTIDSSDDVVLNVDGRGVEARRLIISVTKAERYAVYVDRANGGEVIRRDPMFLNGAAAKVFVANPVTTLNAPQLQDNDDAASAVPSSAYSTVTLDDLVPEGTLAGPNAQLIEYESPVTPLPDASDSLIFDRSDKRFEGVNAYYAVDQSQRYLQSLGFAGSRRIIAEPMPIDPHGSTGADNSYYSVTSYGHGVLIFGDGGVDDAEDPDIVLHEYAHAIQDFIAPGAFFGQFSSESRALGEAISDYWAFSSGYQASVASGRDPFCIGDWDARCADAASTNCAYPAGADCLRRVDTTKTMDDYTHSEQRGIEHENSLIWSSALREIFMRIAARDGAAGGKQKTDSIVVESLFGTPPSTTFASEVLKLLDADRALYGGADADIICSAMASRKIATPTGCGAPPRGVVTFFATTDRDIAIPDANPDGIVSTITISSGSAIADIMVHVAVTHPHRGDLRIWLEGPDGTTVRLQNESFDAGHDLDATYDLDAVPVESLHAFLGKPAAGVWKLHVADIIGRDTGSLVSWDLLLQTAEAQPVNVREPVVSSVFIPVAGHAAGAQNTFFMTDLTLRNRSSADVSVFAYFTPSGVDGSVDFDVQRITIGPGETIEIHDVVYRLFRRNGSGSIELRGDVDRIDVASRTYNDAGAGTYGEEVPLVATRVRNGENPLHLVPLKVNDDYRTNIGLVEMSGASATVRLTITSDTGAVLSEDSIQLAPWEHFQFPLTISTPGPARAMVEVSDGAGSVAAYASIVDNVSGDATFVSGSRPSGAVAIPAAARMPGAMGSAWTSELSLANPAPIAETVRVIFTAENGARASITREIAAGGLLTIDDVVASIIGHGFVRGALSIEGNIVASSRTFTSASNGSFGDAVAAVDPAQLPPNGTELEIIGIRNDPSMRTNIGFFESSGNAGTVHLRLLDGSGALLAATTVTLKPHGWTQFPVASLTASSFSVGAIVFTVEGDGRVIGYASIVDNRTNDPTNRIAK